MRALDHTSLETHLLDDDALLAAVLDKDDQAWSELMRRYRPLVFRCVTKVASRFDAVLSSEDANEIFSELCMNLLRDDMRKLRAFDPRRGTKLGSWLSLLGINTAYDYLRAASRRPVCDMLESAPEESMMVPDAFEEILHKERWSAINSLMIDFSDRDRRFVHLYYAMGLLPEEVASAMRISVKTVYSKKNKVKLRLEELAHQVDTLQAA
jgi:RNA polymerase sigma-70 factor (ECF subfamily)